MTSTRAFAAAMLVELQAESVVDEHASVADVLAALHAAKLTLRPDRHDEVGSVLRHPGCRT